MSIVTTERLTKILSETQAVISECNSRCAHGSVEVNARLFENVLMELLRHRASIPNHPIAEKVEPLSQPYMLPDGIPERIWLNTAGEWPADGTAGEVTWCRDQQHELDTLYVLADSWIPCSDRMPEANIYVLVSNGVWVGQGLYNDAKHLEKDERWQDEHQEFIDLLHFPVTHWQPLPAFPQR